MFDLGIKNDLMLWITKNEFQLHNMLIFIMFPFVTTLTIQLQFNSNMYCGPKLRLYNRQKSIQII